MKNVTQLNEILNLYPNAKISEFPELEPGIISFICDQGYLNLKDSELSAKELELLQMLFGAPVNYYDQWQAFLCGKGTAPEITGKVRFIFAKADFKSSEFDINTWSDALQAMFNTTLLACFQVEHNAYVLVEQVRSESYTIDDFLGVAQSLDAELNTKTMLFIGNIWSKKFDLARLFTEEQAMFLQLAPNTTGSVLTPAKGALEYFAGKNIAKSYLLQSYRDLFMTDPQLKKIIQTLYHTQGNLTLTAKKLYLHRNSLQYKVNRFVKDSGLDIKKMDELLFCYLLTL